VIELIKKLNLALLAKKQSMYSTCTSNSFVQKKITLRFEKVGRIRTEVEGKYGSSVLMHDRSAASFE